VGEIISLADLKMAGGDARRDRKIFAETEEMARS
jgi:hypothetical protein